jgi:SH3-like domain-containing protein
MSKSTQEPKEFHTESKEIHAVYKHNADRFFDEVEKSIPQYHQSITNLQRSYVTAWQKATESAISMNREFATKTGINTNLPAAMAKIVNDTTEEIIKAQAVENKVVLAAIDATQQAINTFNENVKTFTGLNQGVLQYWIQACTPTRN